MLLKSNNRTAPRSEAASADRARPSRYDRIRSTFHRSSQSTFNEPGDGIGRVDVTGGAAASTALTGSSPCDCGDQAGVDRREKAERASRGVRAVCRGCLTDSTMLHTHLGGVFSDTTLAAAPRRGVTGYDARVLWGGFVGRNSGNGAGLEYGEMGDRLREARVSRGLSLRGLAERLG